MRWASCVNASGAHFQPSFDMLSVAAGPALQVSDGFLQFPVLLQWCLCAHVRESAEKSADVGRGTFPCGSCEIFSIRHREGRVHQLAEMSGLRWSATNYLSGFGKLFSLQTSPSSSETL